MIKTITINGLTIGRTSPYYSIKRAEGFGSPDVSYVSYERPGFHGSKVPRAFWRARSMRLLIGVKSTTVVDYAARRRALFKAFDLPRDGLSTMTFTTDEELDLQCDIQLAGAIQASLLPGEVTLGEVWIPIISPSSLFESQTLTEADITFADGTGIINNTGDAPIFPEIRVIGAITAASDIEIENNETGRTVSLTGLALAEAEYADIDMENETIKKNDLTNLYSYVDADDFWWLVEGNNTINISASLGATGDKKITIAYRLGYIGV